MATNVLYAHFPENLGGGDTGAEGPMDLLSDSLRVTLHTATYTPNQSTDQLKATATNELPTAGGYTALGQALANKTYATTALVTKLDADDVLWSALSVTFRYLVGWDDTPTSPADPLIFLVDTGGSQTLVALDAAFVWHATNGIFTFTVS